MSDKKKPSVIDSIMRDIKGFFQSAKEGIADVVQQAKANKEAKKEKFDISVDDIKKAHDNVPKRIIYGTVGIGLFIITILTVITVNQDVSKAEDSREQVDASKLNEPEVSIAIDEQAWRHEQNQKIKALSTSTKTELEKTKQDVLNSNKELRAGVQTDLNSTINTVKETLSGFEDKLISFKDEMANKLKEQSSNVDKKIAENQKSIAPVAKGAPIFNANSQLLPPPLSSLSSQNTKPKEVEKPKKIVYVEPDSEGYDYMDVEVDETDVETEDIVTALYNDSNNSEPQKPLMHIMKGLTSATLLTAINAPTFNKTDQTNVPVLFSIDGDTLIANNERDTIEDCLIQGSASGNVNTSRADILLTEISCSGYDIDGNRIKIEQKIDGWVIGEDGAFGLEGRLLDSSGKVITKVIALEMIDALAQAMVAANSPQGTLGGFSANQVVPYDQAANAGLAQGVSGGLDIAFEHYQEILSGMYPTISVLNGKKVDIFLKGGEDLQPSIYQGVDIYSEFDVME